MYAPWLTGINLIHTYVLPLHSLFLPHGRALLQVIMHHSALYMRHSHAQRVRINPCLALALCASVTSQWQAAPTRSHTDKALSN